MAEKPIFDTVRFGGFDKEEVLQFVSETLEISEKKEKDAQTRYKEQQDKINLLSKQVEILTKRNQDLENGAPAGFSAPPASPREILDTQHACEVLVQETKARCRAMLDEAKLQSTPVSSDSSAFPEIQERYRHILTSLNAIQEVSSLFEQKLHELNGSLDDLKASVTDTKGNNSNG